DDGHERADGDRQRLRLRARVRAPDRGVRRAGRRRHRADDERAVAERARRARGGARPRAHDDRADGARRRRGGPDGGHPSARAARVDGARAGGAPHAAARHLRAGRGRTLGDMPELRTETMTVNMGPQHPSTHGVFRLVLELDGETIVSAKSTIGYLHTGIEKTAENKKWQQVVPLIERTDYLGAQSNSLAFVLS